MAFGDDLQRRIENAALYFQGGVRRSLLLFAGLIIVLLTPTYFLGVLTSNLWRSTWFDSDNGYNPKIITELRYDVSETEIVPLADGTKDLYISVSNKRNSDIGFYPWNYTLQVLNANDEVLSEERVNSYLLPDDTKFIVANSDDPQASKLILTEDSGTQSVLYNPNSPTSAQIPDIEIRSQRLTINDDGTVNVFAQFKNNDLIKVETVDVLYIIRDTRQAVVGIGTLRFSGFGPGDLRDINLNYPAPADREPRFLDLRWEVNYLDENIVKTV